MWRQRFRSSQNAGKRQKARRSHSARKGRKLGDDTASDEEDSRIRCIHHHHKIDLHYHPGPMPAATPAIHLTPNPCPASAPRETLFRFRALAGRYLFTVTCHHVMSSRPQLF
jgi:hypothetical protein